MKLARAAVILDAMERALLAATGEELGELVQAGLVVDLDPSLLPELDRLYALGAQYGGMEFREPATCWGHGWVLAALESLEAELRSDFHRLVTPDEKLAEEEARRVALRGLLGALRDPDRLRELQQTAHVRDRVVAPGAPYLRTNADPWSVYAITRFGREMIAVLRIRGVPDPAAQLAAFLKEFRRADAAMTQLAGALHYLDQAVQGVPKGKHHVVAGLAKSGLRPGEAVAAFVQARAVGQRAALPVEQPHLAVACVRQLGAGTALKAAHERLGFAHQAIVRAGLPTSTHSWAAAKAVLAFPDLNAAIARLRELVSYVTLPGVNAMAIATRLLAAPGTAYEAADRWQRAGSALSLAGLKQQPELAYGAASIATIATTEAQVEPLVAKAAATAAAAVAHGLCDSRAAWSTALALVSYPGRPEEAVATALQLASRISGGARPNAQSVELACAFAKRFAIKPPSATAASPSA